MESSPHYLARDSCTVNGMVISKVEIEIKIYSSSIMSALRQNRLDNLK